MIKHKTIDTAKIVNINFGLFIVLCFIKILWQPQHRILAPQLVIFFDSANND